MKIKLKNTKLHDTDGTPILFYHASPCQKIDRFLPLTHFGSQKAAQMRSQHFMYQTLQIPDPAVLSPQTPSWLLRRFSQMPNAPKLLMYSVYLALKSPLKIPDLSHHSLEQYYRWFDEKYAPKSHFLTGAERCEGDVTGPAKTKYKRLLSDFIFKDPFTQTKQDLQKELSAERLYSLPEPSNIEEGYPAFLASVVKKKDPVLFALAERVAFQRMIRFLQGEGYDGFVYQNEYEDKGQNSYIIFRPEQVFTSDEVQKEHEFPFVNDPYLIEKENSFFMTHQTPSPTQRIAQHRQMQFKKRMLRSK